MARKLHTFDQLAQDLADYIESAAEELANAVMEGPTAPFAAPISQQDALAYYQANWYLPDGTPNAAFRDATFNRVGVQGFQNIVKALQGVYGRPAHPSIPAAPVPLGQQAPSPLPPLPAA